MSESENTETNTLLPTLSEQPEIEQKDPTTAIIHRHVGWAVAAGLAPIPLLDLAAVTAIQLDMLRQLATHYGQNYNEDIGKTFVTALAGSTVARLGASAIKTIPVVGSVVGSLSMSVLSGASTYALGHLAKHRYGNGDDLNIINMDTVKETYDDLFQKGKKLVAQLEKEAEEANNTDSPDNEEKQALLSAVERLASLRDKGILSEEEFAEQKAKLLERL